MCLLAYKPAGTEFDWTAYSAGFASNPDGAGFAVTDGKGLTIEKGFFSFDEFREALEPHAGKQAMVHFRITTHGETNDVNCHPFDVGGIRGDERGEGRLVVGHNGVISAYQPRREKACGMSDTWHYTRNRLWPLWKDSEKFYHRDRLKSRLGKEIGWSKLVLLAADGDHAIINDHLGINEKDGHWYSNSTYVKYACDDWEFDWKADGTKLYRASTRRYTASEVVQGGRFGEYDEYDEYDGNAGTLPDPLGRWAQQNSVSDFYEPCSLKPEAPLIRTDDGISRLPQSTWDSILETVNDMDVYDVLDELETYFGYSRHTTSTMLGRGGVVARDRLCWEYAHDPTVRECME